MKRLLIALILLVSFNSYSQESNQSDAGQSVVSIVLFRTVDKVTGQDVPIDNINFYYRQNNNICEVDGSRGRITYISSDKEIPRIDIAAQGYEDFRVNITSAQVRTGGATFRPNEYRKTPLNEFVFELQPVNANNN